MECHSVFPDPQRHIMKFNPKNLKFVHEFPDDREWLDEEFLKAKLVNYDGVLIASISFDPDDRLYQLTWHGFKYKYYKYDKENSEKPALMAETNNFKYDTLKFCKEIVSDVMSKFLPEVEYIRPAFQEEKELI